MQIVLLGYRGSGKSTIGRRLAERSRRPFVDSDEMIVKTAGQTIREIFEKSGESRFRDLETVAIQSAIEIDNAVIALGGGAILRDENRRMLREANAARFYLRCEPAKLLERILADLQTAVNRPALTHLAGGIEEIEMMLQRREPLYREVMTSEVDVTNLSIDMAVERLQQLMGESSQ